MARILIVDDERSIRVTLCEFLRPDGHHCDAAADADEALTLHERNAYDVIVSDIIMPRTTGIQLLEQVRKQDAATQIIIMTGEPTVDTAVLAVQKGANDYRTKPIRKDAFLKTVQNALKVKQLINEKQALEAENRRYQKDLEETIERRTGELQKNMQGVIYLLSSVVEVRDPYTAGHQRRVGNLAVKIAEKMNLDKQSIDYLRISGYIHDIGKIVIPAEILTKPGDLSQLEMEMIKLHPSKGYEMLAKVNLPDVIAETIYQHHERCDGSGYPRGLDKSTLSRESKILIVADVVEAMMSHRPYRPARGLMAAIGEIRENAGRLYDIEVVEACCDLFLNDNYEIDEREHPILFPL